MNRSILYKALLPVLLCSASLLMLSTESPVKEDGLALTPPMGWNSWNAFHQDIDENKIREITDAMVNSGMKDAGYEFVVIDDGWMAADRDDQGNLQPDREKFPNGMKAVGDYIHSKGLKFGLYECRGKFTCQKLPGSYGHEEQDMRTFASYGVDYVKLDACYAERNGRSSSTDLEIYSKAIDRSGRPMILSISDFGNGSWAWGAKRYAHLWRTSYDISPDMDAIYYCANTTGGDGVIHPAFNGLWQFAGPGHWNDPDMLEVGMLENHLQDRAHFSLWCILAAPLMAGNDLRSMTGDVAEILTAPEVIAVDQDSRGMQGYKIYSKDDQEIYNKPLSDGTTAVLLLNKSDSVCRMTVRWNQIGLSGSQKVRDLWEQKDLGKFTDSFTTSDLPQNGLMLIRIGTRGSKPLPGPSPVPAEKYTAAKNGMTWLSDLYYIMKQGSAPVADKNASDGIISLGGRSYNKGLGCRGNSRIMYVLGGRVDKLTAVAGIDDGYKGEGTARFSILNGDYFGGQILFDSGTIGKDSVLNVDVDVKGVENILLMIESKDVPADWADLKVMAHD